MLANKQMEVQMKSIGKLHGRKMTFPFCEVTYFNITNPEMVRSSVIKASRVVAVRGIPGSEIIAQVEELTTPFYVGLFYLSLGFTKIFTKLFNVGTDIVKFGLHKSFYSELCAEDSLPKSDYEDYPRGFTMYSEDEGIFSVIGGSYLTNELARQVCEAFKYAWENQPWQKIVVPLYTNHNVTGEAYMFTGRSKT
jgi:hypothetical protein